MHARTTLLPWPQATPKQNDPKNTHKIQAGKSSLFKIHRGRLHCLLFWSNMANKRSNKENQKNAWMSMIKEILRSEPASELHRLSTVHYVYLYFMMNYACKFEGRFAFSPFLSTWLHVGICLIMPWSDSETKQPLRKHRSTSEIFTDANRRRSTPSVHWAAGLPTPDDCSIWYSQSSPPTYILQSLISLVMSCHRSLGQYTKSLSSSWMMTWAQICVFVCQLRRVSNALASLFHLLEAWLFCKQTKHYFMRSSFLTFYLILASSYSSRECPCHVFAQIWKTEPAVLVPGN